MAAVLSPANTFTRNTPSISSEEDAYGQDWRQKYFELQETLAATRADLEEFQLSSKELEEEMTLEIERTEKVQQELQGKVARFEGERDEWKSKFITLQTTHNTTTTSLQREIDTLRQQQQKYKVQLRELEIGNDDLERNERAVLSSLADVEAKYSRVLEEKILLEQELLDKASLEEQTQRLKDELRDASEEISNLKRLLDHAQTNTPTHITAVPPKADVSLSHKDVSFGAVKTIPTDLQLSDLVPEAPRAPDDSSGVADDATRAPLTSQNIFPASTHLPHTPSSTHPLRATPSAIPRSSGLPVMSPLINPRGQTFNRSLARPISTLSGGQSLATKSKGVQMISALRSRVQTTQQRLIPGIPRLRLGSTTSRTVPPGPISTTKTSIDNSRQSSSLDTNEMSSKRGNEIDRKSGAQSPGWVLIQTQEDSPYPDLKHDTQGRSASPISPVTPSVHKHGITSRAPSGIPRRPPSRLSLTGTDDSPSTLGERLSADSSSIALSSRPTTPTFLPVPLTGHAKPSKLNANGPSAFSASMYNPRRSSLETGRSRSPYPESVTTSSTRTMTVSTRDRPTSVPVPPRSSFSSTAKPVSGRSSALGKSRIGKPSRRSTAGEHDEPPPIPIKDKRPR